MVLKRFKENKKTAQFVFGTLLLITVLYIVTQTIMNILEYMGVVKWTTGQFIVSKLIFFLCQLLTSFLFIYLYLKFYKMGMRLFR